MATLGDVADDISRRLVLDGSGKTAELYDCIRQAIRMNQRKRYWFLRTTGNVTIAAGAGSISVPADFSMIESVDLLADGYRYTHKSGQFRLMDWNDFKDTYLTSTTLPTGTPSACSLVNTTLYINYAPSTDLTAAFTYFKKDISLPTAAGQTSVWFDDGYDLIRSTAQFIMETSVMQNPDATNTEMLAMMKVLDDQHTFYERARK